MNINVVNIYKNNYNKKEIEIECVMTEFTDGVIIKQYFYNR